MCYWPTTRNSITKICPKLQVLSSHFSEVNQLHDECWAKHNQWENISTVTTIYVLCYNTYWRLLSRNLVYLVWPWYSTWVIREWQSCLQQFRLSLQNMTSHNNTVIYCHIVGRHGFNANRVLKLSATPWQFVWHWACQCTDTSAFFIAELSIFFSFSFANGDLGLTEF